MSAAGRAAWAASVASGVTLAVGIVLVVLDPTATSIVYLLVGGVLVLAWAALAVMVARVAPDNVVAPLVGLTGLNIAFTTTRELGWQYLAVRPAALADLRWLTLGLREAFVWLLASLALLLLYFPDGRLPSRRWRAAPPLLVLFAAICQGWGLFDPAPFRPPLQDLVHPLPRPPVWVEALSIVAFLGLAVLLLVSAVSLVVRYRTGTPRLRAQVKWLALAGAGLPGFLLVCGVEVVLTGTGGVVSLVVGLLAVGALPVALGIAMLRHDLYDVDQMLSAAVTYSLVSAVLVGVFAGAVLTTGLVVARDSAVSAVAATTVTALALTPVRGRVQRAVDRRLYPRRRAALDAVADLQHRIHAGAAAPESLEEELRTALRDPQLRVGYRVPGSVGLVDASGRALHAAVVVPVQLRGEEIGGLAPGSGPASPELLRVVADASSVLVEVVRLRLEVTRALRDVEASRARLVHVGNEERRRLERDLHDGSQQRLVSLGVMLRVAQRQLASGTVDVSGLLDQTVTELATAIAELRQIAHGLRPSCLDDGLGPALRSLTHALPVPVTLDVTDDHPPDDLTVTLYYVAAEAITNAVKHADADRIDVRVVSADGVVTLRVADDGRGGATPRFHSGLIGLQDRVAAAGGRMVLDSPVGRGTLVEVTLPCES